MIKYEFYVTPPQIGGEIQGDTHTDIEIDRHTNLIGQADRPTGIDATHPIGLLFG